MIRPVEASDHARYEICQHAFCGLAELFIWEQQLGWLCVHHPSLVEVVSQSALFL